MKINYSRHNLGASDPGWFSQFPSRQRCHECNGSGAGYECYCETCGGEGKLYSARTRVVMRYTVQLGRNICPVCCGNGVSQHGGNDCRLCGGSGYAA